MPKSRNPVSPRLASHNGKDTCPGGIERHHHEAICSPKHHGVGVCWGASISEGGELFGYLQSSAGSFRIWLGELLNKLATSSISIITGESLVGFIRTSKIAGAGGIGNQREKLLKPYASPENCLESAPSIYMVLWCHSLLASYLDTFHWWWISASFCSKIKILWCHKGLSLKPKDLITKMLHKPQPISVAIERKSCCALQETSAVRPSPLTLKSQNQLPSSPLDCQIDLRS